MPVTHKLRLDVSKSTPIVPQRVVVRQGEADTQIIEADILKDGTAYSPMLSSVRLDIMHADGTWARVSATKSGSKATCTVPGAALNSPGLCRMAHFVFYSGSDKAETTEGFELRILPAVVPSAEEVESYDDKLTKLYEKWARYEEQAERNEQTRVAAENSRDGAEAERRKSESKRVSEESARSKAEEARKASETSREKAEEARKSAEEDREASESARVTAETARSAAEQARASAEAARVESQEQNDLAQAKNNADQAANNAAAQGLVAVIVEDFDPETMMPNGEGQNGKMYLVPLPEARAVADSVPVGFILRSLPDGTYAAERVDARGLAGGGDVYVEWLWINGSWERIGLSTATIDPITTEQIDAVVAGENPQGKQVLNLTGLSYLFAKLKAAFAALKHTHKQSEVEGLTGDLQTVRDSLGRVKVPKNGHIGCGAWNDNAQVSIVQDNHGFILNVNVSGLDAFEIEADGTQKRIGHIPYAK